MDDYATVLLLTFAIVCIVLGGWVVANYEPVRTGNILVALALLGSALLFITILLDTDDAGEGPEITKGEIGVQFLGGIFGGIIPIVLSLFTPLTLVMPIVALSVVGKVLVSILIAPPIEEFFFLMLACAFYAVMLKMTDSKGISILSTLLVVPLAFAFYHWYAYGATLLVSGAFIGAAVFRLLTLLIVLLVSSTEEIGFSVETVAPVIIATTMMHMVYNIFILGSSLSVVGG